MEIPQKLVSVSAGWGDVVAGEASSPIVFDRLYAAYAGVFLLGAMTWGWALEGVKPDRFDVIGGVLVLAGIATILWGRSLYT